MSATTTPSTSITELIAADHRCVEALFKTFNCKDTIDVDKQIAAWKIIRELSIHATVEEEVLYPVLKKTGAEGVKFYDRSIKEHLDLKKMLYELDEIDANPKDNKTAVLMKNLESAVQAHVKEEETEVLPFLSQKCDANKLSEIGKTYCQYKPMMPTRPHPNAPIGSYLGDRALAIGDYVKDKIRFANIKDISLTDPSPTAGTCGTGVCK